MKLIVGLGNPGREYTATRHNAGTWWISRLADQLNITLKAEPRFHGLCARIGQGESELWLLNPQTYMNASGRAVAALCRFYKIEPQQMLVVHDELDLPPGTSRLKLDGGLGGHNGLKDIAASRNMTLSELVASIDADRRQGNLSSAIRLFVLDHYRAQASGGAGLQEAEARTSGSTRPVMSTLHAE